ncbi:hypothetical protein HZR84_11580 [Hyphobacterium sp. CCMP332]|nr:hypothetical protein HZR84_11580 [Hyphobacterium sp. CCMP332]
MASKIYARFCIVSGEKSLIPFGVPGAFRIINLCRRNYKINAPLPDKLSIYPKEICRKSKENFTFAPQFIKGSIMSGFSTKKTRLRVRSKTRNAKLKHLQFQPVIKKVDVEEIKKEFASKPAKKETKKEEPKAEVKETKVEAKTSPEVKVSPEKEEAPKAKKTADVKIEEKAAPKKEAKPKAEAKKSAKSKAEAKKEEKPKAEKKETKPESKE